MAFQPAGRGDAVTTVGFIVEGDSEKILVESEAFQNWLHDHCGLVVANPVVNAGGNGALCSPKISSYVKSLKLQAAPDKIVVLADLDPEECAPCITRRKEIIGMQGVDLIVIANKAPESWFLADNEAMRKWTGDSEFTEENPEKTRQMPWDRLKEIGLDKGRGPGHSKKLFARKFIRRLGFDICRAARHPGCPSARYFMERVCDLGQ